MFFKILAMTQICFSSWALRENTGKLVMRECKDRNLLILFQKPTIIIADLIKLEGFKASSQQFCLTSGPNNAKCFMLNQPYVGTTVL